MDDTTAIIKDEIVTEYFKESKISIDRLHEAKPCRDISIKNKTPETKSPAELSTAEHEIISGQKPTASSKKENASAPQVGIAAKIETVFEKLDITGEKADSTTGSTDSQSKIAVPPLNFEIKGRLTEHQGDILSATTEARRCSENLFSVEGLPSRRINATPNSNVFPVGCMGCKENIPLEVKPSPRRFLDANDASKDFAGHLDSTPKKRPSSGRQEIQRNPLTGAGMEPTDSRRPMIKRKDGNPVLGTGYETDSGSNASANRIPPGGYSKGLW